MTSTIHYLRRLDRNKYLEAILQFRKVRLKTIDENDLVRLKRLYFDTYEEAGVQSGALKDTGNRQGIILSVFLQIGFIVIIWYIVGFRVSAWLARLLEERRRRL